MRLTGFGAVVLAALTVCAIVVVLASGGLRTVALTIGVLVLAMIGGEGVAGGLGGASDAARKREVLTRYARRRRRE